MGHRPEPLLHERLWACGLLLDAPPAETVPCRVEAGLTSDDVPVAWRQIGDDGPPTVEHARHEPGRTVVETADGTTVTTMRDAAGRPLRTTYAGEVTGEETYHYEGQRLVAIDESDGLGRTVIAGERFVTGGRLTVEHDVLGAKRIVSSHEGTVWERLAVPWPERLSAGAATITEGALNATRRACANLGLPPTTSVFGLSLIYVDQGSLHASLAFGLEEDRQAWVREGLHGEDLAAEIWYLNADNEGLNFVDDEDLLDPEDNSALLRDAACAQPLDPYRVVLGAAAARLARADWSAMLTLTDDFVVFVAEHDEGFEEKLASVRESNPPERVARFEARWPQAVAAAAPWA